MAWATAQPAGQPVKEMLMNPSTLHPAALAQQAVSVTVDQAGGEARGVPTGCTHRSVGACLRDPHA